MNQIFINNLPYKLSWQDLKDFLNENVGNCTFVKIFQDQQGRSKGCAIAEFADKESWGKALATLNETEMEGRKLSVREDKEQEKRVSPKQVYLGNIPENLTMQDIVDNIKPLQPVEIQIRKNFALIALNTPEDANACILALNGKIINGKALDAHIDKKGSKF